MHHLQRTSGIRGVKLVFLVLLNQNFQSISVGLTFGHKFGLKNWRGPPYDQLGKVKSGGLSTRVSARCEGLVIIWLVPVSLVAR